MSCVHRNKVQLYWKKVIKTLWKNCKLVCLVLFQMVFSVFLGFMGDWGAFCALPLNLIGRSNNVHTWQRSDPIRLIPKYSHIEKCERKDFIGNNIFLTYKFRFFEKVFLQMSIFNITIIFLCLMLHYCLNTKILFSQKQITRRYGF